MYTLLVTKGPDRGLCQRVSSGRLSVGTGSDMSVRLTDRSVEERHFVVIFEEGGWKAVTYEPDSSIVIDRRWQHPQTGGRGARIFVGESQLLLFAGKVTLDTAVSGSDGLDFDAETLRDDAVNQVRDRPMRFRDDMTGKAQPVGKRGKGKRQNGNLPKETMPADGSEMFSGKAGMLRVPIPEAKRKPDERRSPPGRKEDKAEKALVKGQMISLSDTSISAMPSSSRDLAVLHDRDGIFASELRILATRMGDLRNRMGYKSFLITSVDQGDGKTVTAANLALVMSEDSDRKIALVDANFRGPRAAELFNLDDSRGLIAAIKGEFPLQQCVARVVGRNLIVLHAGGEHKNPSAVLSSPKFKGLLAELYQAVDFMIVDAPSALPFADVPLLTQHVDAVFMVGAAGRTNRTKLDKAIETIGRSRVVGGVFLSRSQKSFRKS